jgi:uncharacterized membrane protein
MVHVEDAVAIKAPAELLWRLTLDVQAWPTITPTMTRVVRLDDAPMRIGSQARIKQPGQSEAVWTVTRLVEGREFAWRTRRLGLTMTGAHVIESTAEGCRNTLTLDVEGRGAAVFGWVFGRMLRTAIATENAGFRARAEELAQPSSSSG